MRSQTHSKQWQRAMTWLEVFLVVTLFFILIGLLLPMTSSPHCGHPSRAKVEMACLTTAIVSYELDYGRWPIADLSMNEDVTYGINPASIPNLKNVDGVRLIASNSNLILVLMDLDLGVNAGHKLNPKKIKYLSARMVEGTNSPGVSAVDHQYRDPWGNPYIITLDSTRDNQCSDFLYCRQKVSQSERNSQIGFNDLFNPVETNGNGNHFYYRGKVIIWSAGPDKKFDLQKPANAGVNQDNVLSWQ